MRIVADTSALLAVLLGEPETARIVNSTRGHSLIGPRSITWEIGNAFSSMLKRRRLSLPEALQGFDLFMQFPIEYLDCDVRRALEIADHARIYAYDAYFLDCAMSHRAPLLTLDHKLRDTARILGITVWEV